MEQGNKARQFLCVIMPWNMVLLVVQHCSVQTLCERLIFLQLNRPFLSNVSYWMSAISFPCVHPMHHYLIALSAAFYKHVHRFIQVQYEVWSVHQGIWPSIFFFLVTYRYSSFPLFLLPLSPFFSVSEWICVWAGMCMPCCLNTSQV